jgi:hypothetical protein
MKPARVETLVWVLIYGGLAVLILGLWVSGADATVGQVLTWGGGLLALAGVVLIWIRSRMGGGPQ